MILTTFQVLRRDRGQEVGVKAEYLIRSYRALRLQLQLTQKATTLGAI